MDTEHDHGERCPACGDPSDYCQGHGEIGDPFGADILKLHALDQHQDCHLNARCDTARTCETCGQDMDSHDMRSVPPECPRFCDICGGALA